MAIQKLENYFFFALLIGILALSYMVLKPFLYTLLFAAIFAIVFKNLHARVLSFVRVPSLAAMLTVIIVLITVLVPLVFFSMEVFNETQQIYNNAVLNGGELPFIHSIENFINKIQGYLAFDEKDPGTFTLDFNSYVKNGLNWIIGNFGSIFSGFAYFGVSIFLFLFSFYYMLKDGPAFKKRIISLSPLADKYDEEISKKMEVSINSIVKGTIVIAIIQGFLTGLGLFIFGVPHPAFWGSAAVIASLIPGLGTSIVSLPAVIYLFLSGQSFAALGMLLWAIVGVGLIDNLLYPKMVGHRVKIHSFFIMLFVFGGLAFFGPLGFLMGPITLSLLFALLDVYKLITSDARETTPRQA